MTTYTITGASTLRNLGTARTGGDIYNVNGGTLTIDQDTRYGQGGGTAFSLSSITLSATLGGLVEVDARNVRLIPYTGGSGTIAAGSTITCGGATGIVIGLYSAVNVAPVLTGVAAGWIKVTGWNGVAFPTSGAFTQAGFTFTINGADKVGFIELVGDEGAAVSVPRLGTFRMRGEWYDLGTTSGSNATTYQLPTNGSVQYFPGVQVETGTGTGVYEWYPCAGSLVAANSVATDAVRGKVCWISTAGLLRLGSDGTNAVGYVPPAGRKIRVPNIITANCTTAARATNALPNATLATRYDFATTTAGVIDIEVANLAWHPSFAQPYSVRLVDVGINDQLLVSEVAAPLQWDRVCVGMTAAQPQYALSLSTCLAGGVINDCVWSTATLAASARNAVNLSYLTGFTFNDNRSFSFLLRSSTNTGGINTANLQQCVWNNPIVGSGRLFLQLCDGVEVNNLTYFDNITGTTGTTQATQAVETTNTAKNVTINGISFGGLTNVHPYTALAVFGAGSVNCKLRNIGTRAAPLNLGTVNASAYTFQIGAGSVSSKIKVQRVYTINTRTNFYTLDNSCKDILIENSRGDFADAPANSGLGMVVRAVGCTPVVTGQSSCYGTHWYDAFTSDTVGRIGLNFNEPTAETAAQVALTGGAAFTSSGSVYMPTIGQTAEFTMPYSALGHTSFSNTALVMGGGAVANHSFAYQIDTGSGFGAWSANLTAAALGTALNALGAINPAVGVRLKLRITTVATNVAAISSIYIVTGTTAVAQDNLYPLDTNTVTFTGLPTGTDVVVLQAGTSTILAQQDAGAGSSYAFTFAGAQTVDVGFLKAGFVPLYIRGLPLAAADSSIPVAMTADRNYL